MAVVVGASGSALVYVAENAKNLPRRIETTAFFGRGNQFGDESYQHLGEKSPIHGFG